MYTCDACYRQSVIKDNSWIHLGGGLCICDSCQSKALSSNRRVSELSTGCYAGTTSDPRVEHELEVEKEGSLLTYSYGNVTLSYSRKDSIANITVDGVSTLATLDSLRVVRTMIDSLERSLAVPQPGEGSDLLKFSGFAPAEATAD